MTCKEAQFILTTNNFGALLVHVLFLNNVLNIHDCTQYLSPFCAFQNFKCLERKGLCYYVSDCTGAFFTACQVLPGRQGWISPPADVPIDHGARFCCMENQ
jgi:hypothetical protein